VVVVVRWEPWTQGTAVAAAGAEDPDQNRQHRQAIF
jgi:hypothetical protein